MFDFLKKHSLSTLVIVLFAVAIPFVNFNHHKYASDEGVIVWDIKSYYAYLPATFIYNDLSLGFLDNNTNNLAKWIWPITTPTGEKAILTSMGLSIMYSPFFFIGHAVASISPHYEATGYSFPYHVALQFSTYIYFLISLIFLGKILARYFNNKVIALTLFAIGVGTNLFYYITYDAPMSHGYNFFLIILFIWFLEKWTEKITIKYTFALGLISGLIALIRPTNIIILILIPLWHIDSWKDFKERVILLLRKWPHIVLMAVMFILVWIPQFAYWKFVSGEYFYFSYGERGDKFYFNNPQIWKILFSYEKGWFVYTPLMFVSLFGLISLHKKKIKLSVPIIIYVSVMIYVLSSWWSWWYGGAFGQRSMIDFYGLMAIPLAAVIDSVYKKRFYNYIFAASLFVLIAFNQFNIMQYNNMAISYWWMNKEGYWENFMKLHPTCKYWNVVMHPDYEKARLGIYEAVAPYNKNQVVTNEMLIDRIMKDNKGNKILLNSLNVNVGDNATIDTSLHSYAVELVSKEQAEVYFKLIKIDYYLVEINKCTSWKKDIEKKAHRKKIPFQEMALIEAERIYNNYSQKYDQR